METLDLLEEVLDNYDGTLLLVSHDRDFLDRLASGIIAFEAPGKVGDYPGGYSDYLRQRRGMAAGAGLANKSPAKSTGTSQAKSTAKSDPNSKPPATRSSGKLSYKDQRELDGLPQKMERLTVEVADLDARLAEADFFQRDPDGFRSAAERLAACRSSLEQAEERWLELEELKERLSMEAGTLWSCVYAIF